MLDALVRADAHAAAARIVLRGVLSPDEDHALHPAVTLLMQVRDPRPSSSVNKLVTSQIKWRIS